MERPNDNNSHNRNRGRPMNMQNEQMNSTDERRLPRNANALLTDLVMQMREPNMRIKHDNGERRYGPPSDHVGPPPSKACEVFVAKIPTDAFELELVPIFEKVGKIFDMRILMNQGKRNRGYGFVQYYTLEDAEKAIATLNDYEIRQNIHLGVLKSKDNRRLYISEILPEKAEQDIFMELIRACVEGVTRVIAFGPGCGGVAFVDFENVRTAGIARHYIELGRIRLWGERVHAEWALPEPDTVMLFLRNLAEATTEEQLQDLFNANSGNGVRRVFKMETTAYISFDTTAHAKSARQSLDMSTLDGSRIDVLPIHGGEQMMPMGLGIGDRQQTIAFDYPEKSQEVFGQFGQEAGQNGIVRGIPGHQQSLSPEALVGNVNMISTVPNGATEGATASNPGFPFPPVVNPGLWEGPQCVPPGRMSMVPSVPIPTNQDENVDKKYNFNDMEQFEKWCDMNGYEI